MIRILFPMAKPGAQRTKPLPTGNCGKGLGDKIERAVHPMAAALHWPCLDEKQETLRPQSPCAKARDWINKTEKRVKKAAGKLGID